MEKYCAWCDSSLDSYFDRLIRSVFNRYSLLLDQKIDIEKTHGICDRCFSANFPYLFSLAMEKKVYRYSFYPKIEIVVTKSKLKKCYLDMDKYREKMEMLSFECKPCSRRRMIRHRVANLNEGRHNQATDMQFSFGFQHLN